ncbi:YdeI/OmpD-associated family protein [Chondromyces apiculatus]|uniref:Uncharacterized protein n=1 Tax=Chondromyces apiculatus DSM 436 TaxID=1192034 RepID=A0A017TGZ9_9BACT|nr:YdeI/OmpD-associated family protein [Chondromyces apiculatus]EYF08207.1 Hypothetical protein CAP_5968 [Chondromyces apiculatus DSM 436]
MTSALAAKLQLKAGHRVLLIDAPEDHAGALDPLPEGATLSRTARGTFDVVHLFVQQAKDLARNAPKAIAAVREGGVLWISYPKKTSGVKTDITRDVGWDVVTAAGWGPVTQVAVDDTWSALRFKPEASVQRKVGSVVAPAARAQRETQGTAREAAAPSGTGSMASAPKQIVTAPQDLAEALTGSEPARALWSTLAPSHRKEYVRWIEEARKPETRARRVAGTIEMLSSGKKNPTDKAPR